MSWETTAMRPPVLNKCWRTTHFWQKYLHFNITEPVPRESETTCLDRLHFMANGVIFQDRFYCNKRGGVNQAYSRLSTTHGQQITDCKLDSVVYTGVYAWWFNVDLSCLGQTIYMYAQQFWVPSHRFNSATGEQKGITQTIYTDSEPPSQTH